MKWAGIRSLGALIVMGVIVAVFVACAPSTSSGQAPSAAPTSAPPTVAPAPTSAPVPTTAPAPTTSPPTVAPPTVAPAPTSAPVPTVASTGSKSPGQNPPPAKAVTLQLIKNDELGSFLADGDGYVLYLFTKDTANTSNCYDKCLQQWPALLVAGEPTLKEGVNKALVGTTTRKDGATQVTYNGWPLYYYEKDAQPGAVNGQAVGTVWWVVSGEGNLIKPSGLKVGTNDKLGQFLTDENGKTLYIFTKDSKDTTVCYDKCEQQWPPLLTLTGPKLDAGVDASLVGSIVRKDGTKQVTYNGLPLYYYFKDAAAGDVTGQDVGQVWYVMAPDGSIIKTKP